MRKKVLGIIGSYRKGGTIDLLVTEVLAAAQEDGADVEKIYLTDKQIEFCNNCRICTQEAGDEPGICIHKDDMAGIMEEWKKADGIVIGSPVNFYNITAVTRRFMERLIGFAYWPWGKHGPQMRIKPGKKKAVVVTASAMPVFIGYFFTGALRALKMIATTMGAKPVASVYIGMTAQEKQAVLSEKDIRKARAAGKKLVRD
ncbi:MAG: flavodoxin family protein [Candidatus Aureabacteria bacterium]|nr:flavodoxin family protein [Candidatus Auribacterota bacterium]